MARSSRNFRMIKAKIVFYRHKAKGPTENEELLAQKSQDGRSQGQSENDELGAKIKRYEK